MPSRKVYRPCRLVSTDIFFPENRRLGEKLEQEALAKSICDRCTDVVPCRQKAIDENIDFGIFGGMTADERKTHRKTLTVVAA